jgi:DNA-binding MarR family transcriptional regulator
VPKPSQPSLSLLFDLFVTNQRVRALLADAMAGAGMRADEYAVYSAVFDLGPLAPSDLARTLGMPPTTVTHYLDAMRAAGHLRESANPADRRSYLIRLSPGGLAAHRRANVGFEEGFRRLASHLEDGEATGRALRELGDAAGLATAELRTASRARTA